MTQEDARNFVMALNTMGPYVPPMFYQPLVNSPVALLLQQIANGEVTIEAKHRNGDQQK